MNDESRLLYPLTFDPANQNGLNSVLESVCSSRATVLASSHPTASQNGIEWENIPEYLIMGCEDGGIFVFRAATQVLCPSELISSPESPKRRTNSPSVSSSSGRSGIPYSSPSNIVASHARAVSNLTKERVEAPKSMVDYDEEEEGSKLRALLHKPSAVRDKTALDSMIPHVDKYLDVGNLPSNGSRAHSEKPTKTPLSSRSPEAPRSVFLPSSPASPLSRSRKSSVSALDDPSSRKSSTPVLDAPSFSTLYHILPNQTGPGNSVSSIVFIPKTELAMVLQESGRLSIYSVGDGHCVFSLDLDGPPRCRAPSGCEDVPMDTRIWMWRGMSVVPLNSHASILVYLTASDPFEFAQLDLSNADVKSNTRVACVQFNIAELREFYLDEDRAYELLAEWVVPGPVAGSGLFHLQRHEDLPDQITSYHMSQTSGLVFKNLQIAPKPATAQSVTAANTTEDILTGATNALHALPQISLAAISKPFKSRSHNRQPSIIISGKEELQKLPVGRITLGEDHWVASVDLEGHEVLGVRCWPLTKNDGLENLLCAIWSASKVLLYQWSPDSTPELTAILEPILGKLKDIYLSSMFPLTLVLVGSTSVGVHNLAERSNLRAQTNGQPTCIFTVPCSNSEASCLGRPTFLFLVQKQDGLPALSCAKVAAADISSSKLSLPSALRIMWQPPRAACLDPSDKAMPRMSSILPLEPNAIILGYTDGYIRRTSFSGLTTSSWSSWPRSTKSLRRPVTGLHTTHDPLSGEHYIVGSTEEGDVAMWDVRTLKLRARWALFCEPLRRVISLPESQAGRLKGCMICVSNDGTIAVISLDGLEFLYLVPGSMAPLQRICVASDNLLLLYGNSRTRLWDLKTLEFWRSMGQDKVVELLDQGGWYDTTVERLRPNFISPILGYLENHADTIDTGRTLVVNMIDLVDLVPSPPQSNVSQPATNPADGGMKEKEVPPLLEPKPVDLATRALAKDISLRALLSSLLTFGLDDAIDTICEDYLGILKTSTTRCGRVGYGGAVAMHASSKPAEVWQISSAYTAQRLLAITIGLRSFLAVQSLENHASGVLSFYLSSLPDAVGPSFKRPSLPYLGSFWYEPSVDIKQAARLIFDATLKQAPDEFILGLVDFWQHQLPVIQPDIFKDAAYCALALLLTGNVAVERYTLFSPSTLTDVSKSVALYLHDETCPHRAMAIELCSRGFHIWQNYVDAMGLLRSLFRLTSASPAQKEGAQARNLGQLARTGVLQIAASNTPLFISTISLDIMDTTSLEHRGSTMQLVAFVIRKKPLVLYPNLPRLVEAVVKSLDPNWSSGRDAVLDSAIEFLGQVVRTYPSIDFHMQTQRLAVGTNEGAVIMYDLKTASRMYVLEGFKTRLSACTFSPDGRRLVTVSLEESVVMVWKVGSSFTSFFMPGAPPRQGSSGSQPYKTFPFNVGDDANMTLVSTFDSVLFEWPSPRSARLTIRNSIFTFAT